MKYCSSIKWALAVLVFAGCGKSATVTPPIGGGMTEAQIQESSLEPIEETFGRPMVAGEEPKK